MMINFIMMLVIGIMLFVAGIVDIRKLRISRKYIIVFGAVCVAALLTGQSPSLVTALSGTLIGMCALGISLISGEQLGRGDGLVLVAVGLAVGFRGCLVVVSIASIIMCLVAIVLLALKKGNRKTKLPFIPAIFAGYAIFMITNYSVVGVGAI
jgi:leader peptidase (prepilin peptidase)/N-methyltransferase